MFIRVINGIGFVCKVLGNMLIFFFFDVVVILYLRGNYKDC